MQNTPYTPEACTIFNLERTAIAESNREISLNQRTELTIMCPHFKSRYFKFSLTLFYLFYVSLCFLNLSFILPYFFLSLFRRKCLI